jgi:hypothetical protein
VFKRLATPQDDLCTPLRIERQCYVRIAGRVQQIAAADRRAHRQWKRELMRYPYVLLFVAVVVGMAAWREAALADSLSPTAEPAVRCAYRLLKSSSDVQSVEIYAIDPNGSILLVSRSAVEFRFNGKDGRPITADLMLLAGPPHVTADVNMPRDESQEAGWESLALLERLHIYSDCGIGAALDDLIPGPKPRSEWIRLGWPSLSPAEPTRSP